MTFSLPDIIRQVGDFTPQLLGALFILFVFWLVGLLVGRVFRRVARSSTVPGRVDIIRLFGRASRWVIFIVGVVSALGTLGINVTAMVAGLGLTGFALSFALKDVLSNAISGVLILFYQPFRRGDRIKVEGFEGEVISIDLRYTRLDVEGDTALIPNAVLFTKSIHILSRGNDEAGE